MPQASDELRDYIIEKFGDIDCGAPEQFLEKKGWTLANDGSWTWSKPGFNRNNLDDIPEDEWLCILFLVHEWDYGGVKEA
jgi:hypothetical protein